MLRANSTLRYNRLSSLGGGKLHLWGHIIPVRFALFALIGGLGLVIQLAVLWVVLNPLGAEFGVAQTVATVLAMTFNFFLLTNSPIVIADSTASLCYVVLLRSI